MKNALLLRPVCLIHRKGTGLLRFLRDFLGGSFGWAMISPLCLSENAVRRSSNQYVLFLTQLQAKVSESTVPVTSLAETGVEAS